MGEFRFWVTSKVMAESSFGRHEGSETVRFSGSQFRFAVSPRTGRPIFHGDLTERSKIVRLLLKEAVSPAFVPTDSAEDPQ